MKAGDIVRFLAPTVGYKKYHFCICPPDDDQAGRFLFLNSDPNFRDCLSIDCARIPFLPKSKAGVTAISFSLVVRCQKAKLSLFRAEVLGPMPLDVIEEMRGFLQSVTSLPDSDKATVRDSLRILTEQNS